MTAHDDLSAFDDSAAMVTLLPPPAKRARLALDTTAVTVTTADARLLPVVSSISDRLLHALTHGVVGFLTLTDATAVVQTSRLLRTDVQLLTAMARLVPDFKRLFPDEASVVFRLQDHWVQRLSATPAAPLEAPAHVVATAAFLQKRVAKWCFQFDPHRPNPQDDLLCSVQPVLLPLALFHDPSAETTVATTKWSRAPIKDALNAFRAGGGDAFFDAKRTAESRFATHWDSIYVDRVTGRVSCRLCDATRDAIALYKRQVETGLRQHELLLRCQEATWTHKTPDERVELAAAFTAKCFPPDAYLRPECAAWPDEQLLRHICDHGKLQAWQIGDTRARGIASTDALLRAVSFKYQHQCRTFYQPLQKSLHAKCHVVGRLPHAVLRVGGDQEKDVTELVGGVDCATGMFSGAQVTFRLKP